MVFNQPFRPAKSMVGDRKLTARTSCRETANHGCAKGLYGFTTTRDHAVKS